MTATPAPARRLRTASLALVVLSAALSALAVFQWIELFIVRSGGHSICALSAHVSCEAVWNSDFASRVHRWLGLPVAGFGLVYALTALTLSGRLLSSAVLGGAPGPRAGAVKVTALAGIAACLTFATVSFQLGSLCLTCLGTYLLVLAFAGVAFFGLPEPLWLTKEERLPSVLWAGGLAMGLYLVLLWPGLQTPQASAGARALDQAGVVSGELSTPEARDQALREFLGRLSDAEKDALGEILTRYRAAQVPPGVESFPVRHLEGDPRAPMRVVEFTDILCPHCRHLADTLRELRARLPPGLFSVESRYFPLDGECNPLLKGSSGDGVRCEGAKVEICLEGRSEFAELQRRLFEEQAHLSPDRIQDIALSGPSLSRPVLDACIVSPATSERLMEDIRYAEKYHIEGTPLVLINGKEVPPMPAVPAFLYAMALAGGDANASAFSVLPTHEAAQAGP